MELGFGNSPALHYPEPASELGKKLSQIPGFSLYALTRTISITQLLTYILGLLCATVV